MKIRNQVFCGDCRETLRMMPEKSVHLCVTSPPYWGQRDYKISPSIWGGDPKCNHDFGESNFCLKCGAWKGQLGLEPLLDLYIENLVSVFDDVKRVLRDDGTFWLNIGNAYVSARNQHSSIAQTISGHSRDEPIDGNRPDIMGHPYLKDGDLAMILARVAIAMQEKGWLLRSEIIWAKALSFCPAYSGSVIPESVNGTRWEKHRIKVKGGELADEYLAGGGKRQGAGIGSKRDAYYRDGKGRAQYIDCPGCPKCEENDGYVLRKGSWRPTAAHEIIFMFTKEKLYYCDKYAVSEDAVSTMWKNIGPKHSAAINRGEPEHLMAARAKRNLRDVFCFSPESYREAHFAVFPKALPRVCIRAGTSERGVCSECGKPYARVVDKRGESKYTEEGNVQGKNRSKMKWNDSHPGSNSRWYSTDVVSDWMPTCKCGAGDPVPAIVLDPFAGAGTTGVVAIEEGRDYCLIEISEDYVERQIKPRLRDAARSIRGIRKGDHEGQTTLY